MVLHSDASVTVGLRWVQLADSLRQVCGITRSSSGLPFGAVPQISSQMTSGNCSALESTRSTKLAKMSLAVFMSFGCIPGFLLCTLSQCKRQVHGCFRLLWRCQSHADALRSLLLERTLSSTWTWLLAHVSGLKQEGMLGIEQFWEER